MVAVDFTAIGDLYKTVSHVQRRDRPAVRRDATAQRDHRRRTLLPRLAASSNAKESKLYAKTVKEIKGLHRLPRVSEKKDRHTLLGPLADTLPKPPSLEDLVGPSVPTHEQLAEVKAAGRADRGRRRRRPRRPAPTTTSPKKPKKGK